MDNEGDSRAAINYILSVVTIYSSPAPAPAPLARRPVGYPGGASAALAFFLSVFFDYENIKSREVTGADTELLIY